MHAHCDKYANYYCSSFNASKSKCLVVLPPKCRFLGDYIKDCNFYVGNNPIEYVDSFEHLGHVIPNQLTDSADILKRRSDFVGKSNNFLCFFSKLSSLIKYRLIHLNCMSLYGRLLSNDQINDLCVSWRKSQRRIWGLPFNSHWYFAPAAESVFAFTRWDMFTILNFIKSCICRPNGSSLVRAVTNYGIQNGRHNSLLGHNLLSIQKTYQFINVVNGVSHSHKTANIFFSFDSVA